MATPRKPPGSSRKPPGSSRKPPGSSRKSRSQNTTPNSDIKSVKKAKKQWKKMEDRRNFTSGFTYLLIRLKINPVVHLFLSPRNKAKQNYEKHMANYPMLEQQLYTLYMLEYLPSKLSYNQMKVKVQEKSGPNAISFESFDKELNDFITKYNETIEIIPGKFVYDSAPTTANIVGEKFEEEFTVLLREIMESHGITCGFRYPDYFDERAERKRINDKENTNNSNNSNNSINSNNFDGDDEAEDDDNHWSFIWYPQF